MANNKNENLEVKNEVTPEANKPEEQKGEEPEVNKKNGVVMKALKKVGNAVITFPKKHPIIASTVASVGAALVGMTVADKAKEYRRDHYPTLPINNDVIDTTFKPVPEDLPAPETTVDDQINETFVDTVNQVIENPEIRTF